MSRNLEFEIFESKFTTSLLKFLKINLTTTFYTFNKTRYTNNSSLSFPSYISNVLRKLYEASNGKSGNLIEYFTPKKKKRNQRPN